LSAAPGAFAGEGGLKMLSLSRIVSALLVAIGITLAGYLAGQALITSREPIRTVTVKGLSERNVIADLGYWPIKFVATGPTLEAARSQLEEADASVRRFLVEAGFPEESMNVQNI